MASVDLKDAYYTVPMQRDHQTFLKFEFRVAFINTLASLMASRVLHVFLHRYLSQFIQHCTIRAIQVWDISYLQGDTRDEYKLNIVSTSLLPIVL